MVDSTRVAGSDGLGSSDGLGRSDGLGSLGGLVLGIDASTTACKAVVWDSTGNVVAQGRAPLSLFTPRPLWHEQRADDWWAALVTAVNAALVDHRRLTDRIVALCIAPQRETFVPVDAAGTPLRNAIVWMDERSRELLPGIAVGYGGERFHQTTGKPLSGNLAIGKIQWLRRHEPEVFASVHRFLDVAAFLNHKLTGLYRTGWGCVDPMGLFDMCENAWSESLLDYLGVSVDQMPEVCPTGSVVGELTETAAELCGLRPGTAVVAGVGDGQSGGLGANITEPGRAYLNLGTAVVSGTTTEDYVVDRAFRTMVGGVPGTYSLETVLLGGTYTVDWFLDKLVGGDGTPAFVFTSDSPARPYIQLFKWNGERYVGPRILAYYRSTFNNQHAHPHPRFTPDGTAVLYSSDLTSYSNMDVVEVIDFVTLPPANSLRALRSVSPCARESPARPRWP